MTQEEAFELAKRRNKEASSQTKKEKKPQYRYDHNDIAWTAIEDHEKAFRIIGPPAEIRRKPTHMKLVFNSRIVNDSKKNCYINWAQEFDADGLPTLQLSKTWILHKFYDSVNKQVWDKTIQREGAAKIGAYVPLHSYTAVKDKEGNVVGYKDGEKKDVTDKELIAYLDSKKFEDGRKVNHPILDRILINSLEGSKDKYPKPFYPKKRILMNVIDRMDDWCKENKHSKLLTTKHDLNEKSDSENPQFYTDLGIPFDFCYSELYNQIIDKEKTEKGIVFLNKKNFEWEIDVVFKKNDKKYEVYPASLGTQFNQVLSDEIEKVFVLGPTTEEELSYGLYDLDKMYPVSSYTKLFNNFSEMFKAWDVYAGTKFYSELEALKEKEEAEKAKNETEPQTKDSDKTEDKKKKLKT